MSLLLDTTHLKAEGSEPVVGFEQPAYGDSVGWNRYLTLLGERAYFIGGACDTCAFIFERMGGANRNVSPEKTADAVRNGWYCTGDVGVVERDGFVRITGRISRFAKGHSVRCAAGFAHGRQQGS